MVDFLNLEKIASLLQSNVDVSRLVGGYFIYYFFSEYIHRQYVDIWSVFDIDNILRLPLKFTWYWYWHLN